MGDELLPYYNDELRFIRELGAEFADDHKDIAARLRLSKDKAEDPHVERLIQAFAYLNARIRHKLDDDFPELTEAMLGVLYPHYLMPTPSMAMVQLRVSPTLTSRYEVKRGSNVETAPIDGEPCRFRTCYPVDLWPITVASAKLDSSTIEAPRCAGTESADAVLHLRLKCLGDGVTFEDLRPDKLRFHLRGRDQDMFALHQLILNDAIGVAITSGADTHTPTLLANDVLQTVGFADDEALLPYPAQSFIGYRLLTEFFTFPQKFLFFDLLTDEPHVLRGAQCDVYIYLKRNVSLQVDAGNFALGCTPIINLFKRSCPTTLDPALSEYRVVPDARRPKAFEVYSVDSVAVISPEGGRHACEPLYGIDHAQDNSEGIARAFWKANRRAGARENPGSETFLSIADLNLEPAAMADWVIKVETTCMNRDLPNRLPYGGGEPRLRLTEGAAAVEHIEALSAPTPTLRPALKKRVMWRLLSHLNLNYLSISDAQEGAKALREILLLYDFKDSEQTRAMIHGVAKVQSRSSTARLATTEYTAIARGVEVTVEFDPQPFPGNSVFLFAAVLERFLALYCNINSFTRLVAKETGREDELCRWPPRAGDQILL